MNLEEIKLKYEEYREKGWIRPPELITDEDWDNYYGNQLYLKTKEEMLEEIAAADEFVAKEREHYLKNKDKFGWVEL